MHIQAKYSPSHFYSSKQPSYGSEDNIPLQTLKSVATSLLKLTGSPIDVLLLHQLFLSMGQTYAAWEVLEEMHRQGGTKHIGICQVNLSTLTKLYDKADIKPSVVQNYFARSCDYDRDVRRFCRGKGIVYQAFGMFATENAALLDEGVVSRVAAELKVGRHAALLAILWALAQLEGEGLCLLDGSRDVLHLEENWTAYTGLEAIVSEKLCQFPTALGGVSQASLEEP